MYVEAYWNLHKECFSYRPPGGRVIHASGLVLLNPTFAVQPAGRDKVRSQRRKNVHAFVRGELRAQWYPGTTPPTRTTDGIPLDTLPQVRYNPYVDDQWHLNGTPIYELAGLAYLINRKVYVT